jgi:hypothetical protein
MPFGTQQGYEELVRIRASPDIRTAELNVSAPAPAAASRRPDSSGHRSPTPPRPLTSFASTAAPLSSSAPTTSKRPAAAAKCMEVLPCRPRVGPSCGGGGRLRVPQVGWWGGGASPQAARSIPPNEGRAGAAGVSSGSLIDLAAANAPAAGVRRNLRVTPSLPSRARYDGG